MWHVHVTVMWHGLAIPHHHVTNCFLIGSSLISLEKPVDIEIVPTSWFLIGQLETEQVHFWCYEFFKIHLNFNIFIKNKPFHEKSLNEKLWKILWVTQTEQSGRQDSNSSRIKVHPYATIHILFRSTRRFNRKNLVQNGRTKSEWRRKWMVANLRKVETVHFQSGLKIQSPHNKMNVHAFKNARKRMSKFHAHANFG